MTPTLIITRPKLQGIAFAAQLRLAWDEDLHVILSPLLQIVSCPVVVPDVAGLIFTSVNGVAQTEILGLDKSLATYCVGEKTALASKDVGFDPMFGPGTVEGLAQLIIKSKNKGPFAHIRGRHSRGGLSHTLTHAGVICHDVIAYEQLKLELTIEAKNALAGENPVVLPLFSPRTSAILKSNVPFAAPLHTVAISQAAQPEISSVTSTIAIKPNGNAMLDATINCLNRLRDSRNA